MNLKQLEEFIIIPTITYLDLHKTENELKSATRLLVATCAHESLGGQYLKQISGPALGIYQIEPKTHNSIFTDYLLYREELLRKVSALLTGQGDIMTTDEFKNNIEINFFESQLIGQLYYSTAIARIIYYRCPPFNKAKGLNLPDEDDIEGMSRYWKKYYNTELGKGTEKEFVKNFEQYYK